jgi:4-amino-4-deoxy-L-arabinose transferase-like glycosyltransferase
VLVAADGTVMSETAFGLLATLCVLLAYRMRETAAPPSARLALAFGVAVGAAALARPEGLALLLLLLLVPGVRGAGRPGMARAALALAATAIVLAPWMIHLWATFGRPVPLAVNGSTLVAGANCRQTYGGPHIGSWDFDCVSRVPRRNDVVAAGAELRRGAAYAAHHVGELPLVVLARLGRTFDLFQPGHEERVAEGRAPALSRVGAVVFWLLMPLGAYGAVVLRRRRRPLGPLWVPVGLVLLVTVAGYGIPRFRHPAEFTLLVLAAAGLVELVERRAAQPAVPGAKTRASGVS